MEQTAMQEIRPCYMGWYDPDKKRSAQAKLKDALRRYHERFGTHPTRVLTSPQDAQELGERKRNLIDHPLDIQARGYVARHTFYLEQP